MPFGVPRLELDRPPLDVTEVEPQSRKLELSPSPGSRCKGIYLIDQPELLGPESPTEADPAPVTGTSLAVSKVVLPPFVARAFHVLPGFSVRPCLYLLLDFRLTRASDLA